MEQGKVIKTFKSKKGNDVVFRYPKPEDLDDMLAFANGLIAEDTFVDLSGEPMTKEKEEDFLKKVLEDIEKGTKIYIVVFVGGVFAGTGEMRLAQLRRKHVGNIGIALDKKYRDEEIGTVLLKVLIDQAKKRRLRLITLNCFENNTRACHVYEKLGFVKAGIVPGAISYKNEYIGEIKFYLPLV